MMLAVLNLPFKAKPFGDIVFHEEAKKMALFFKGDLSSESVTITWAPGPVLFFAIPYTLATSGVTDNELWYYGIVWTGIFITISMLLIFQTALRFFNPGTALLTIVLFMLFPLHVYYSLGITGEAPAFFALALMLYGWSDCYFFPEKLKGWLFMGSGYWFMILNRPNAVLFFGFLILILAYTRLKNKPFFTVYGRSLIITFTLVFLAAFSTMQAAKLINGTYESPQEGLFYYVAQQGRFQFREEPTDFRFWDDLKRPDSKDYQNWVKTTDSLHQVVARGVPYVTAYRNFVIQDVLDHPFYTIRQFFVKAFYGHLYYINSIEPEQFKVGPLKGAIGFWVLIAVINSVNLLLIIGIFLFIFRWREQMPFFPFYAIILSLVVFHSLMYMEARYLFPSKPAFYILSAAGLYTCTVIKKPIDAIARVLIPKIKV